MEKEIYKTPEEYERYVASLYEKKGYTVEVTNYINDGGIDIIARNEKEKIAIQAKMYGNSSRKINRATISQLYGDAHLIDCTKAVIATDGDFMPNAIVAANKLGIEILNTSKFDYIENSNFTDFKLKTGKKAINKKSLPDFGIIWDKYIKPLENKELTNTKQKKNIILSVNNTGILRMTSTGNIGTLKREIFKFAHEQLNQDGYVYRDYINQEKGGYCSSGIVLVLEQVPFIERFDKGLKVNYEKLENSNINNEI